MSGGHRINAGHTIFEYPSRLIVKIVPGIGSVIVNELSSGRYDFSRFFGEPCRTS
jgi:hypothetical protein